MKATLIALQQTFESSSTRTPEYLAFHRLFKREFTKLLTDLGCSAITFGKPNHFDVSGFFTDPAYQAWYFSLSDLRWSKDKLLIRTAKDYKDYSGGSNQYIVMQEGGAEHFRRDLQFITRIKGE